MKKASVRLGFVAVAALMTGCAQFEQTLSTVGPSGSSTSGSSLVGTWTSSSSIGAGLNSCTNFQWKLTGQQGDAVSGEFSAICGSINVSGTVSGQIDGSNVPYQLVGSATLSGVPCTVSVSGTAHVESDLIRVPYAGTTCFGPTQGEEVLRRSTPQAPAPPAQAPEPDPAPAAPAPPSGSSYHVGPGPLSVAHAEQVVNATRDEFPGLIAPRSTEAEGIAAAAELLRRMIWHLHLAGYDAGRQRNPSGVLSSDKLTVFADGAWHAFDVFRSVATPGQPADVIFLEVFPASAVADEGIPD